MKTKSDTHFINLFGVDKVRCGCSKFDDNKNCQFKAYQSPRRVTFLKRREVIDIKTFIRIRRCGLCSLEYLKNKLVPIYHFSNDVIIPV